MLNDWQLFHCDMIGNMFILCNKWGIDADSLAENLLTTEYGISVMNENRSIEYSGDTFMLEGFRKNTKLAETDNAKYMDDELWFAGYLYKYWYEKFHTNTREIYRIAALSKISAEYGFLHTQGWDYVIDYLIDRQEIS